MSFSSDVKKELCGIKIADSAEHCAAAEIAGIINACGVLKLNDLRVQTEELAAAKRYIALVKGHFVLNSEISLRESTSINSNRIYYVKIKQSGQGSVIKDILNAAGLTDSETNGARQWINPATVRRACCKRAYIRGAFIGGGFLSDPERYYHLEIINNSKTVSGDLARIIHLFNIHAKTIPRKGNYAVYLTEGEAIVDLLNIMGAHISLMDLENVRIIKDMRNNVNRTVNCETANLKKTVGAAVKQTEAIEFIRLNRGLGFLSAPLAEAARFRIMYPEASLKEIGEMLSPPVSKSGVNHRLRKINYIAEDLKHIITEELQEGAR